MPEMVQVPKLGLTMTEGTVSRWVIDTGSSVTAGEVIAQVTTDKVEFDVEASTSGTLHHAAIEGATLKCGEALAWIAAPGEVLSPTAGTIQAEDRPVAASADGPDRGPGERDNRRFRTSPKARRLAGELGVRIDEVVGTGPGGRVTSRDVEAMARAPRSNGDVTPLPPTSGGLSSPLARRLATRVGVDVDAVTGSGPGGRVMLDDVVAAAGTAKNAGEPAAAAPILARVPLRGVRGAIARRMSQSLGEMAQATLSFEVEMDAALELRSQLILQWATPGHTSPTITDLVTKAAALALIEHPALNATVVDNEILQLSEVNIGLAVSTNGGLTVPVIRRADRLPLAEVGRVAAKLARRARDGSITLPELEGSTFSISSMGASGVRYFTPIVNPPNVAILGIGAVHTDVTWEGGSPMPRRNLGLSLTIDHRAIDGVPAAEFVRSVSDLLANPLRLLAS